MGYTKYTIDDLPELPLEALSLGGDLEPALTEPVLTIRPKTTVEPESKLPSSKPPSTLHCPSSSSHYVRKYLTQVTYPKVTCHPNNALTGSVVQQVLQERQNPSNENQHEQTTSSKQTQFY